MVRLRHTPRQVPFIREDVVLTRLDITSAHELTDALTRHGVLFSAWGTRGSTKPLSKLIENFLAGELVFLEDEKRLVYETWRSRVIVLAKIKGKLRMLLETRAFPDGTVVPPSYKYSVSEKLQVLRSEEPIAGCIRGMREELGVVGLDPASFTFCGTRDGRIHRSRSYPGLWSKTHTHTFELMLPERFFEKTYVEKAGYCTSTFSWHKPEDAIVRAHKARQKQLAA